MKGKTRNQPELNRSSLEYLASMLSETVMRGMCVGERFKGAEYDVED